MQTNVWLLASWGGVDRRLVVIRHWQVTTQAYFGRHRTRIEPIPRLSFTAALKKKKQQQNTAGCSILSRCKHMSGFLRRGGGGWPKIGRNSSLASHNSSLFGRHRTRIEPRPRPSFTAALKIKNKNKILPRVPCF